MANISLLSEKSATYNWFYMTSWCSFEMYLCIYDKYSKTPEDFNENGTVIQVIKFILYFCFLQ